MLLLTLLLSVSEPAEARSAEVKRQQSELHALARKGAWSGVDRAYRALVATEVPLDNEDHLVGYEAARQLGEPLLALRRVQRVQSSPDKPGDSSWTTSREILENLALNYGLVNLVVTGERLPVLIRGDMPFAPDQRAAVERLAQALRENREVRGMLPLGTYTIDGESFTVGPSADWQAVVVD